jgi:hypothetical protein
VQAPWHYASFTAWALPFLWIGTALTVRRLRDAGLSPLWVALFVLPVVNIAAAAHLVVFHEPRAGLVPGAGQGPVGGCHQVRVLIDECVDWRLGA